MMILSYIIIILNTTNLKIKFPELKTLDLSHNYIVYLELISKIDAPKLKKLDLTFTQQF